MGPNVTKDHAGRIVSVNTKATAGIWKKPQADARLVGGHRVEGGIVPPGDEVTIV
jgi:hypothetical protein